MDDFVRVGGLAAVSAALPRGITLLGATSGSSFPTKDRLDCMRRNAMSRSFTWELSAGGYCALYRKAVSP
jgi:glycogen synthase